MWLIGGYGTNILAYSYDGFNWTHASSINTLNVVGISTIAWNGSMWVIGGSANGSSPNNTCMYSYDGINWYNSVSGTALFVGNLNSICWTGTLWVGVAAATSVGGGSGGGVVGYSTDGINWTNSTSGSSYITNNISTVAYNGTVLVAAGNGTNSIIYSYDGINWNNSANGNNIFPSGAVNLTWNGTNWIACYQQTIAYSTDGINWTLGNTSSINVYNIASRSVSPYANKTSINTNILTTTTNTTSTYTIDCSLSSNINLTLVSNITLAFTNLPQSGIMYRLTLMIIQAATGSNLITWPGIVDWGTTGAPILSTAVGQMDIIELLTFNGGSRWFGSIRGQGYIYQLSSINLVRNAENTIGSGTGTIYNAGIMQTVYYINISSPDVPLTSFGILDLDGITVIYTDFSGTITSTPLPYIAFTSTQSATFTLTFSTPVSSFKYIFND